MNSCSIPLQFHNCQNLKKKQNIRNIFGFRIDIHEEMCEIECVVVKTSAKNTSLRLL
jgi:hypothetical protein